MNDDSPRVRITGGGPPSDAELAAIVVALTPVRREDGGPDRTAPGWRRAAILEGIGLRPVTSAADLGSRRVT